MTDYLSLVEGMTDEIRRAFKKIEKDLKGENLDTKDLKAEDINTNDLKAKKITIDEALNRMKNLFRNDSLISATFDTPKDAYIFYAGDSGFEIKWEDASGETQTTSVQAWQMADAMAEKNPNFATISQTQAGKILWDDNFKEYLKCLDSSLSDTQIDTHLSHADNGFWRAASENYARNAKGPVIALTPFAGEQTVFYKGELPELLKNKNITHINGQPMDVFKNAYDYYCTIFPNDVAIQKLNQLISSSSIMYFVANSHLIPEVRIKNGQMKCPQPKL